LYFPAKEGRHDAALVEGKGTGQREKRAGRRTVRMTSVTFAP
jgi:hypothetical protein